MFYPFQKLKQKNTTMLSNFRKIFYYRNCSMRKVFFAMLFLHGIICMSKERTILNVIWGSNVNSKVLCKQLSCWKLEYTRIPKHDYLSIVTHTTSAISKYIFSFLSIENGECSIYCTITKFSSTFSTKQSSAYYSPDTYVFVLFVML